MHVMKMNDLLVDVADCSLCREETISSGASAISVLLFSQINFHQTYFRGLLSGVFGTGGLSRGFCPGVYSGAFMS